MVELLPSLFSLEYATGRPKRLVSFIEEEGRWDVNQTVYRQNREADSMPFSIRKVLLVAEELFCQNRT